MTETELDIIGYEGAGRIRGVDAVSVSLVPVTREQIDDLRAALERAQNDDRVRGGGRRRPSGTSTGG